MAPRNTPTTSADADASENKTAEVAGGDADATSSSSSAEVAPRTGTATVESENGPGGTLAGDDGKPKRLHVSGLHTQFGPVKIGSGDDLVSYTITREGTEVAGEHVAAVREAARLNHVPLRTTAAKS